MPSLPASLRQLLAEFAARQRRLALARGAGWALALWSASWLAGAAADRWLGAGPVGLAALRATGWALALGAFAAGALPAWLRLRGDLARARAIERACAGRLQERMSAAVQLADAPPPGASAWMVQRTVALAANDAALLDVRSLADARPARRSLRLGLLVLLLAGGLSIDRDWRAHLLRAGLPGSTLARPGAPLLLLAPGDGILPRGAAWEGVVTASPDPGEVDLEALWDDGVREVIPCPAAGPGRYQARLPAVTRGVRLRAMAHGGESRTVTLRAHPAPRVAGVRLSIQGPAYAGSPTRLVSGGDAEVLAGSRVEVIADLAGAPCAEAAVLGFGAEVPCAVADGTARAQLAPGGDALWGLRLVGRDGLMIAGEQRWRLHMLADRPPAVRFAGEGARRLLAGADEVLDLAIQAEDDVGLRSLSLAVEVGGDQSLRHLPIAPGLLRAAESARLALATLGLRAGDSLRLTAVATDLVGNEARSTALDLAVGPPGEGAAEARATRLRPIIARLAATTGEIEALARSWSALARAARGDDPAALRASRALVDARGAETRRALVGIAAALADEREGASAPAELGAAASELRSLAAANEQGERGQLALIPGPGAAEAAERGAAAADAAAVQAAALHADLDLLAARMAADGVAARAEVAVARLRWAEPLLRGERGWMATAWQPGLAGSFVRGNDPGAIPTHRAVEVPGFSNRDVPGLGPAEWAGRWIGEVNLPAAGEWTFTVTADDGVRLAVDGRELLPETAWRAQAPTSYRGTASFAAGWHAIRIDFFQGGGGSFLSVALARGGDPPRPLARDDVRCAGIADPRTEAAMAVLPAGAATAAAAAADAARRELLALPAALAGDIQATAQGPAAALSRLPPARAWGEGELDTARRRAEELRSAVRAFASQREAAAAARWNPRLGSVPGSTRAAPAGVPRNDSDEEDRILDIAASATLRAADELAGIAQAARVLAAEAPAEATASRDLAARVSGVAPVIAQELRDLTTSWRGTDPPPAGAAAADLRAWAVSCERSLARPLAIGVMSGAGPGAAGLGRRVAAILAAMHAAAQRLERLAGAQALALAGDPATAVAAPEAAAISRLFAAWDGGEKDAAALRLAAAALARKADEARTAWERERGQRPGDPLAGAAYLTTARSCHMLLAGALRRLAGEAEPKNPP